ncbi:MAG: BNR-repeat neuraminidase N-terminal domain-containing protein [Bacteroidota bacterium]
MLVFFALLVHPSGAQVNLYSFSQYPGTYVPITGGTVIAQATDPNPAGTPESGPMDNETYTGLPLPFNFTFNGIAYSSINICTNGWVSFTSTGIVTKGVSATQNAISGFGGDLVGVYTTSGFTTAGSNIIKSVFNTSTCTIGAPVYCSYLPAGTIITAFDDTSVTVSNPFTYNGAGMISISWTSGDIRAETIGVAPNRVFVIQYKGMSYFNDINTTCNFQIRLNENGGNSATQSVEVVYGVLTRIDDSQSLEVGIRGSSASTDYNTRGTNVNWSASLQGGLTSAMTWSEIVSPISGLSFIWKPAGNCAAPVSGSTDKDKYAVCQGNTAKITTTGASAEPGSSYQWQESANGVTGWTNATGTGATTTSYTSPAYTGTPLYYRMNTTCSFTGATATTPVATIGGTGPSIQARGISILWFFVYSSPFTVSWTNGSGNNRSVYINSTNSFTGPVSPNSPGVPDTVWRNAGQQLIYDGPGPFVNITGLKGSSTYYIRVYESLKCTSPTVSWYYNTTEVYLNPRTYNTRVIPPNDECVNATLLTVGPWTAENSCASAIAGTTYGATPSSTTVPPSGTLAASQDDDVWYEFVATQNAHLIRLCTIRDIPHGSSIGIGLTITSGCGAADTVMGSALLYASGEYIVYPVTGLTPGRSYKIRVFTNGTTYIANFDISVQLPRPMFFHGSTTVQASTSPVVAGSINQQIIRVEVQTSGYLNPMNIIQFNFKTNGTTNAADILGAKVYYTGTSNVFSTANQYGATVPGPSGSFSVVGNQQLASGVTVITNYFWLVYDIACGAAAGNVVDAECTTFYINTPTNTFPTVAAPAGNRPITAVTNTAAAAQASVNPVAQGATNAEVITVTLSGCANTPVTKIDFNTAGSTNAAADIMAARVYYTTTPVFSTAVQFGTDVPSPNGTFSVTGNQSLTLGSGYFWLVYDLAPGAVLGNIIDATCTSAVINGITAIPPNPNPTGARTIIAAGFNDEASTAIPLTVGGGCSGSPYNNATATQSALEPYPACKGTAGYAGMWFKFIAPSSGGVRISNDGTGSMGDSRLSLFAATNAGDYSTFTNIACDDNSGVTITTRAVLYATGLTPGSTYYILVDVFDGSTQKGSYCVTVDELAASMLATAAGNCIADQAAAFFYNPDYRGWISLVDAAGNLNTLVRQTAGTATGFNSSRTITTGAPRVDAVNQPYLNRNFFINGPGATSADLVLFFTNAELASLGAPLNNMNISRVAGGSCVAKYPGGATFLPQTASGTANGASWVQVTTPGFSNFYLHSGNVPLPITLVYFNGNKSPTGNQLYWKVNCTSVSVSFEVERSSNGRNFTNIGTFGANQTRCLTPFDFADSKPVAGVNYYRIKIIDVDGKISYTNVVAINNKVNGIEIIGMQPTLVQNEAVLNIAAAKAGKLQIAVTDMTGRQLETRTISVLEGENKISLSFGSLAAGVYSLSSFNESGKTTIRFVKE